MKSAFQAFVSCILNEKLSVFLKKKNWKNNKSNLLDFFLAKSSINSHLPQAHPCIITGMVYGAVRNFGLYTELNSEIPCPPGVKLGRNRSFKIRNWMEQEMLMGVLSVSFSLSSFSKVERARD